MISERFHSFWNYILRLFVSIVVFFLYLYIVIIFSTDGSSNSFVSLFYLIIFSIPICLSRIAIKSKVKKIAFCLAVMFYLTIIFVYYSQFINTHIAVWLAITSLLLIKKVILLQEDQEVSVLLPSALFALIVITFAYCYSGDNSYFRPRNLNCSTPIFTQDIVGISQESKRIIDEKDIVIVDSKTCSTTNGNYMFIVRPIKNKFFSQQSYALNSDVQTFNELLSEIQYVSNFYNSYLVSYGSGVAGGIFNSITAIMKSLIQILFHPLDTLSGIYNAITSIPSQFLKVKNDPSMIIEEPIHDARKYLDATEKSIAQKNNIDIDKLILSETKNALRHERNILVAGEKGTELGMAVVPFFGSFGKTAKVMQTAVALKATKAITTSSTKVAELAKAQKIIVKPSHSPDKIAKTGEVVKPTENVILNDTKKIISSSNEPSSNLNADKLPQKTNSKMIKGDGPEDQLFDKDTKKALIKRGEIVYDETSFQKGTGGIRGKKPSPDGMSVDYDKKTKTYYEDKRPSEWGNNSWLSHPKDKMGVIRDPIEKERAAAIRDYKKGKITKAEAEARIVIAEHDDHFLKRGTRWNDPDGVPSKGFKENLGLRIPDSPPESIDAIIKYLKDTGRNPEKVVSENGFIIIKYDIKKRFIRLMRTS